MEPEGELVPEVGEGTRIRVNKKVRKRLDKLHTLWRFKQAATYSEPSLDRSAELLGPSINMR